nr:unnamed protein product [Spirometra erinaceieuropaei]
MLFQQLIVGLRDEKARENLLSEKKDLSWEKACDIASHQERVRQNLQQLNQSNDGVISSLESETAVSLVNTAVSSPRQRLSAPSKQVPSCYRCGQHHMRWSDCRHQKTVCQFCKKVGHIERVCFSKRRANSNTHATYPSPAGDGEAILRMFPANATLQSPYTITLPVDHHPVKFEIDTGSAVTLINEASLQKVPSLLPASSTFQTLMSELEETRPRGASQHHRRPAISRALYYLSGEGLSPPEPLEPSVNASNSFGTLPFAEETHFEDQLANLEKMVELMSKHVAQISKKQDLALQGIQRLLGGQWDLESAVT